VIHVTVGVEKSSNRVSLPSVYKGVAMLEGDVAPMRILRSGVALAVIAVIVSSLVSGCELREGDQHEYGSALATELDAR
jgi:hypothetical protein